MPSKKANKYGTAAERWAAEKYGMNLSRKSWMDAERNGTPVEIKSCRHRHSDGQPGNFKIYEAYHRRLRAEDGEYCFVVYRLGDRGVKPLKSRVIHSSKLPRLSWHGGGSHRDTQQTKVAIDAIFS